MAEFTEVMRQAKRICTVHGGICSYRCCPLADGKKCRLNVNLDGEDYNELERIIMDWTAEHPELVYPSWEDAWKQIFPNGIDVPCPSEYDAKYGLPLTRISGKEKRKQKKTEKRFIMSFRLFDLVEEVIEKNICSKWATNEFFEQFVDFKEVRYGKET